MEEIMANLKTFILLLSTLALSSSIQSMEWNNPDPEENPYGRNPHYGSWQRPSEQKPRTSEYASARISSEQKASEPTEDVMYGNLENVGHISRKEAVAEGEEELLPVHYGNASEIHHYRKTPQGIPSTEYLSEQPCISTQQAPSSQPHMGQIFRTSYDPFKKLAEEQNIKFLPSQKQQSANEPAKTKKQGLLSSLFKSEPTYTITNYTGDFIQVYVFDTKRKTVHDVILSPSGKDSYVKTKLKPGWKIKLYNLENPGHKPEPLNEQQKAEKQKQYENKTTPYYAAIIIPEEGLPKQDFEFKVRIEESGRIKKLKME